MKSSILTLAIFFTCLSFASAQSFHAGLKVGSNINKISGQSFKDEFTYGYHAGAFLQIGLGSKWTIQPEVLYNQVNTDTSNRFSELYKLSVNKISNIKLSYLSIPVLLNYNLGNNFALQAGPQFGILLDQNRNLLQNGKDAFSKGDFSMLAGVQIKLSSLRVYGRYAIGLNNLNDIDNKDKWKNQAIQLGIGLTIF
jgi:Outer membrane protein beta-barrel domain